MFRVVLAVIAGGMEGKHFEHRCEPVETVLEPPDIDILYSIDIYASIAAAQTHRFVSVLVS